MDIESLCQREVVGIPAGASAQEAAALMREQHVGALVVVAREQPSKFVGLDAAAAFLHEATGVHP